MCHVCLRRIPGPPCLLTRLEADAGSNILELILKSCQILRGCACQRHREDKREPAIPRVYNEWPRPTVGQDDNRNATVEIRATVSWLAYQSFPCWGLIVINHPDPEETVATKISLHACDSPHRHSCTLVRLQQGWPRGSIYFGLDVDGSHHCYHKMAIAIPVQVQHHRRL